MTDEQKDTNTGGQQPPENQDDGSRLHIDDDWKQRAQAEKERLAAGQGQGRAAASRSKRDVGPDDAGETGSRPAAAADADEDDQELPPATFETLVQTLATQAMLFMSTQRDPRSGRPIQNLGLAKHSIDLLAVLEERTRGNLTEAEQQLIDNALYRTRMAFVQAAG